MFKKYHTAAAMAAFSACSSAALSAGVPEGIISYIPQGYEVLGFASTVISPTQKFYFIATESRKEMSHTNSERRAPTRPLFIFQCHRAHCAQVARNDDVIFRADDGGINGCDPFEGRKIAVKGRHFTVEQAVACGAHWTDDVTFRFDPLSGSYLFDNWRTQSWSSNPSNQPDAEALVSEGQKVVRAKARQVPFADWRRD